MDNKLGSGGIMDRIMGPNVFTVNPWMAFCIVIIMVDNVVDIFPVPVWILIALGFVCILVASEYARIAYTIYIKLI